MERGRREARGGAGTGFEVRLVAAEIPRERKYAWLGNFSYRWLGCSLLGTAIAAAAGGRERPRIRAGPHGRRSIKAGEPFERGGEQLACVAACPRSMSFGASSMR